MMRILKSCSRGFRRRLRSGDSACNQIDISRVALSGDGERPGSAGAAFGSAFERADEDAAAELFQLPAQIGVARVAGGGRYGVGQAELRLILLLEVAVHDVLEHCTAEA